MRKGGAGARQPFRPRGGERKGDQDCQEKGGALATLAKPAAKVRDYDSHVLVCKGGDCKKRGESGKSDLHVGDLRKNGECGLEKKRKQSTWEERPSRVARQMSIYASFAVDAVVYPIGEPPCSPEDHMDQ